MNLHQDSQKTATVAKAAYAKPNLIRLGSVSALTAAGSGPDLEQGNPGNCSQNTNARPCR